MARTHYEVLGVSPTAGPRELRRAYLDRARELHPDRYVDAGATRRAEVERGMREVNEAWRILGDPKLKRRYDIDQGGRAARLLVEERRFTTRTDGTMPEEIDVVDNTTRLIHGLPWIVLLVVLFGIFVFTAYAVTGGSTGPPTPGNNLNRCVTVGNGPTVAVTPCTDPGARLVIAQVDTSQPCPAGSERLQPATGGTAYCLEVTK
jgi:hypothetical protein